MAFVEEIKQQNSDADSIDITVAPQIKAPSDIPPYQRNWLFNGVAVRSVRGMPSGLSHRKNAVFMPKTVRPTRTYGRRRKYRSTRTYGRKKKYYKRRRYY